MKLTILSKEDAQDSEFNSFFERNEDTINRFQDLLTFIMEHNLAVKLPSVNCC